VGWERVRCGIWGYVRVLCLSIRIIFGLKRWDLGADMSVHNKGHIGALAFFCGNIGVGKRGA